VASRSAPRPLLVGNTKKEAMRVLERQLSNVVYRRMTKYLNRAA
jgi:hypothetical protein